MPGNDEKYLDSLLNQISDEETENTLRSYLEDKEPNDKDLNNKELNEFKEIVFENFAKYAVETSEETNAENEVGNSEETNAENEVGISEETNAENEENDTVKVEKQFTDEEMLAAIDADVLMLDEGEELPLFEGIEEDLNPADFAMQEELREKLNPEHTKIDTEPEKEPEPEFVFDTETEFEPEFVFDTENELESETEPKAESELDMSDFIGVFDIEDHAEDNTEDYIEAKEDNEDINVDNDDNDDSLGEAIKKEKPTKKEKDSKKEKTTKKEKTSKKEKAPKKEKTSKKKSAKKEIEEDNNENFASFDFEEAEEDIVIEIPDSGVKEALEELGMKYGNEELPLEEIKDFNPTFNFDNILEQSDGIDPAEYMSSDFSQVYDEIVANKDGNESANADAMSLTEENSDSEMPELLSGFDDLMSGLDNDIETGSDMTSDEISDAVPDLLSDLGQDVISDLGSDSIADLGVDLGLDLGSGIEEVDSSPLDFSNNDFGDVLGADLQNLMSLSQGTDSDESEDGNVEEIEDAAYEEISNLGDDESSFSFDAMPEISDTDSDLKDLFGSEFIDEMESGGFEVDEDDEYGLEELEDGAFSEYDVGKEIFGNKKIPASKLKAEKTPEQIAAEKQAKKEAKEAAKALKAEEKEAAKAEKDRIKQEKLKLALVLKEEKKQKKLEAMQALEAEENKVTINKTGVIVILCLFGIVIALSVFGSSIATYSLSIRHANQSFERKDYNDAYEEICGLQIKNSDKELYDKVMTVMFVNKQLNSYVNYSYLGDDKKALDSLIKGLQKYDKYFDLARRIGVQDDLDYVRNEILKCLKEEYDLDEDSAMILSRITDKDKYSLFIDEIVTTKK